MTTASIAAGRTHQWSGAAFVLGSLLFLTNKLDEMSRLFLGYWIPDVISGEMPVLIFVGQVALIIGFAGYFQFYALRVGRWGTVALRLLSGGGILVALGHVTFMSALGEALPPAIQPYAEFMFLFVVLGALFLFAGLIWFGILNFRQPILSQWHWLPLVTGLMGTIGFVFASGEEITAIFLIFRTLFALGLAAMGAVLWQEKSLMPVLA
jgi:hypothetical protein